MNGDDNSQTDGHTESNSVFTGNPNDEVTGRPQFQPEITVNDPDDGNRGAVVARRATTPREPGWRPT